jgi:hypothetical protein
VAQAISMRPYVQTCAEKKKKERKEKERKKKAV